MAAYYNEIDEYAAQWLRNLIKAGHIAPGDVDTRSIEDVTPNDIKGYTQCHWFAGVGVWSYALRRAGWPDDRPVWSMSCPCQPFSVAGKGDGFADERHLWPAAFHHIEERRPVRVFGEQVASKDGYAWLDLVQADLEGTGYTVGAVVAPAAGFGAPHQRHRMYWVADTLQPGRTERGTGGPGDRGTGAGRGQATGLCVPGGLADADGGNTGTEGVQRSGQHGQFPENSVAGGLADAGSFRREPEPNEQPARVSGEALQPSQLGQQFSHLRATSGFWSAADWIYCRDEKYRPVEPGTFPLAHGATARVGRLRAYGNAICAPQAEEFIKAYLEVRP